MVPDAAPAPTAAAGLGAADVQNVAAAHGVSPSLAAAIAWQESGFNNAMVSSANARGVMQVMPGTWDYVQQNLAGSRPLDPNSATDNVHAGVMYLKRLLTDAGGDENAAIAGYYQGLASVRERGMYDDTQQYVDNVQALRVASAADAASAASSIALGRAAGRRSRASCGGTAAAARAEPGGRAAAGAADGSWRRSAPVEGGGTCALRRTPRCRRGARSAPSAATDGRAAARTTTSRADDRRTRAWRALGVRQAGVSGDDRS